MKKQQIYYENDTWNIRIKEVDSQDSYNIKYVTKTGYPTKELAQAAYDIEEQRFQHEFSKIKRITGTEYTFLSYLNYWFDQIYVPTIHPAKKNIHMMLWTLKDIITPVVEHDILLPSVTCAYLNDILKSCKPYCQSAAPAAYRFLRQAFKAAMDLSLISKNPMAGVTMYSYPAPNICYYTREQIKTLVTAAKQYHTIYLEVLLALFCGLRQGELLGLKNTDIDFQKKVMSIKRQATRDYVSEKTETGYQAHYEQMSVKAPKTSSSYRSFVIPDIVYDAITERIKENENSMSTWEINRYADYLCVGKRGYLKCDSTLREALKRICKRNNLPRITPHGLRHIYASILIEEGVPLETISALLGHSSTHTTFDIYCGVINAQNEIRSYIETSVDPILGSSVVYEEEVAVCQ